MWEVQKQLGKLENICFQNLKTPFHDYRGLEMPSLDKLKFISLVHREGAKVYARCGFECSSWFPDRSIQLYMQKWFVFYTKCINGAWKNFSYSLLSFHCIGTSSSSYHSNCPRKGLLLLSGVPCFLSPTQNHTMVQ